MIAKITQSELEYNPDFTMAALWTRSGVGEREGTVQASEHKVLSYSHVIKSEFRSLSHLLFNQLQN